MKIKLNVLKRIIYLMKENPTHWFIRKDLFRSDAYTNKIYIDFLLRNNIIKEKVILHTTKYCKGYKLINPKATIICINIGSLSRNGKI